MNTTVTLDNIPGSLFRRDKAGGLTDWLKRRRLCLTPVDLGDERARRGFVGRR
ncbi:hypothetical protein [Rhodococcus rhodochrous]|uniref:hypothetical protein n=1 Tax=Rhodococcus rhodochrous TaxID=1829 RepID=UPI000ACE0AEA|nr:hypothetical protein [Rhodococcus rhodochrous]